MINTVDTGQSFVVTFLCWLQPKLNAGLKHCKAPWISNICGYTKALYILHPSHKCSHTDSEQPCNRPTSVSIRNNSLLTGMNCWPILPPRPQLEWVLTHPGPLLIVRLCLHFSTLGSTKDNRQIPLWSQSNFLFKFKVYDNATYVPLTFLHSSFTVLALFWGLCVMSSACSFCVERCRPGSHHFYEIIYKDDLTFIL